MLAAIPASRRKRRRPAQVIGLPAEGLDVTLIEEGTGRTVGRFHWTAEELIKAINSNREGWLWFSLLKTTPKEVADDGKCRVCGWPLVDDLEKGCTSGSCSMRSIP